MVDYQKRIDELSSKELKASAAINARAGNEEGSSQSPIDIYQSQRNGQWEQEKKSPVRGASPLVMLAVKSVAESLEPRYKAYKMEKKYLKSRGEMGKVDVLRQQYMMETFLPALEAVINQTSPDEVLNCKEALEAFDEWASVPGSERGFTEGYIKQAYGNMLGQTPSMSDQEITQTVGRVKILCDAGQNRAAIGLAKNALDSINAGRNIAGEGDYALLSRVANFE